MTAVPNKTSESTTSARVTPASATSRGVASFLIAQVLIVGVAVAGVVYRHQHLETEFALPPLRETPLEIAPEPLPEKLEVIGKDQLRRVLRKLRPVLDADTGVAKVDHNLRFWGVQAKFDDPEFVSGEAMRDVLLDHNAFRTAYGKEAADEKPFLIEVGETGGIRMRDFDGPLSSSHDDHTMACLAEVGTPLSHRLVTIDGDATFRQVVEQSLRDFSLNQTEYEWSVLTYALFVKGVDRWRTSEGQEVTFDMLADRIMRQEMPQGVCFGNHRLHTLTMLLRVNDVWDGPTPMLTAEKRAEIVDYLASMTQKLQEHQHADGFWNHRWPTSKPESDEPTETVGDQLSDRIIATGHALEWWALVPTQDREALWPPPNVYRDAAQWLVRTVDELPESDVRRYSAFLSHAGRALALWRGKFPYQVDIMEVSEEAETEETPGETVSETNDESPGEPPIVNSTEAGDNS